jgi:plastocyanin
MRRLLQLATLSLVALLFFAPVAWSQGQGVTVRMEDNFFDQANITVQPGTTVTWVQSGNNPRTTTSYDGLWDSGMIEGVLEERSPTRSRNQGGTITTAYRTNLWVWSAASP